MLIQNDQSDKTSRVSRFTSQKHSQEIKVLLGDFTKAFTAIPKK